MSTEYYLKSYPIEKLLSPLAKKCRKSLINDHNLEKLWVILSDSQIDDETVKLINRGIRGPYPNGSLYCGFKFNDEIEFWKKAVERFSENAWLNLIYAEYIN